MILILKVIGSCAPVSLPKYIDCSNTHPFTSFRVANGPSSSAIKSDQIGVSE